MQPKERIGATVDRDVAEYLDRRAQTERLSFSALINRVLAAEMKRVPLKGR